MNGEKQREDERDVSYFVHTSRGLRIPCDNVSYCRAPVKRQFDLLLAFFLCKRRLSGHVVYACVVRTIKTLKRVLELPS